MVSLIYIQANDNISIPFIFIEVGVLMLVSFLIGYFFAFYYQKGKYLKKISALRQKLSSKSAADIDMDFNEDDLKEIEESNIAAKNQRNITELKVYDTPEANTGELDFSRIGYADSEDADDLQKIIGIGPYTEEKLNTIGIFTFDQISKFNSHDIEIITELIQFFPDRIINDNWVSKAQILVQSKQRIKLRKDRSVRMKKA